MAYIFCFMSVLILVGCDTPVFQVEPGDHKAILGAWSVEEWIYSGTDWHVGKNATFKFEKDRIRIPINDDVESNYSLDPTAKLPTIDITDVLGRPLTGIYRIRGTTLWLCLAGKEKGRPGSFESTKDEDVFLIKLRRLTGPK